MSSFNLFSFIPFAAFFVNSLLATYLFAKRKGNKVNNAYYLFAISLMFWAFGDFLLWLKINPEWYHPILVIQSIFWIPVGFLFLNFVYMFIRRKRNHVYWIFLGFNVAAILLSVFTDLVNHGYREEQWGVIHNPGPLHIWIVLGPVLMSMMYGVFLLFHRMLKTHDPQERKKLNIVVSGTAITSIFALFSAVIIPDVFDIRVMPSTHDVALTLYAIVIFIAIEKYSFLKIKVADVSNDMFAKMRDGIVILDKHDRVQHINPSAMKMLNIPFSNESEKSRIKIRDYFESLPELRSFSNYEARPAHSEYDDQIFLISKSPVMDNQGISGSLIVIRDITHQKQYEEEIRQINEQLAEARDAALEASRMKSQFLANMSHELRTPLNAVIGYSEIIEEEAEDENVPTIASDAKKINSAGKHLLDLINDILDLSKIEAGKMELFISRFNIRDLIADVLANVEPLIANNSNKLILENKLETAVHADETKVRQILMNLLSNAAKFTEQGAIRLVVTSFETNGLQYLRFDVIDSGIGMNQEQLQRLFTSFTQADASTTRKYGGTGLGLAISKRFAEMMCGEIIVTSNEGEGSQFSVIIPADVQQAQELRQQAEETVDEEPLANVAISETNVEEDLLKLTEDLKAYRKILIVDDDEPTREILRRYLAKEDMAVYTAASGVEALQIAREIMPDVITLDVMMPGMDGWTVLREIKSDKELCHIPVIMVTMVDDKPTAYANGVTDYLIKPVPRPQLVSMVQKVIHSQNNKPVLIVDDDPEIREVMRLVLEEEGLRVLEAINGEDALEIVTQNEPAMVILDLNMPVLDGFEFLSVFRKDMRYRDIPVIVLTAKEMPAKQLKNLAEKSVDIVGKDNFSAETLISDVKKHIH